MDVIDVLTNKPACSPVRGAGRPQGIFVMERLMDRVALELGLDPARCGGAISSNPSRCRTR